MSSAKNLPFHALLCWKSFSCQMVRISCWKKSFIPLISDIRSWIVRLSHLLHNHDVTALQLGNSDSHSNCSRLYCYDMLSVPAMTFKCKSLCWLFVCRHTPAPLVKYKLQASVQECTMFTLWHLLWPLFCLRTESLEDVQIQLWTQQIQKLPLSLVANKVYI